MFNASSGYGPGLVLFFRFPDFLVRFNGWLLSFGQTQQRKLWKTALNEEIPANEWQQNVKHFIKD